MEDCLKEKYKTWITRKVSKTKERKAHLANLASIKVDKGWGFQIDATLPIAKAWRRAGGTGAVPYAFADPGIYYHSKPTVVLGKEYWTNESHWAKNDDRGRSALENAYVHEWGNLASYHLTGSQYSFAKKNEGDEDSGHMIQKCVFGN